MSHVAANPVDTIRLLLIDDHLMFREAMARMLGAEPGFVIAGQAASATEGLALLPRASANVALVDVDLGAERALDFVRGARQTGFAGYILILTAGMSDQEAVQLVQSGVAGILHKHHSTSDLCDTIRQVAGGKVCLEQAYLAPLFRSLDRTRGARPTLTDRDRTVIRDVLQGLTNREIGGRLQISEGAVKASLRHVCEKLGVRTRTQLVKVALEQYKDQL